MTRVEDATHKNKKRARDDSPALSSYMFQVFKPVIGNLELFFR